jgi:hypothetical protein
MEVFPRGGLGDFGGLGMGQLADGVGIEENFGEIDEGGFLVVVPMDGQFVELELGEVADELKVRGDGLGYEGLIHTSML